MVIIWKFPKSIAGRTKGTRGPHAACVFETPAIDYAHKAYVHALFETFSNQPLWERHDSVKKVAWKIKCIIKKVFYQNIWFGNPVPQNVRLRMLPRFVTVAKMAGIFTKRS